MSFDLEPEPPGQRAFLRCDACGVGSMAKVPAVEDTDTAFRRFTSMPWRFLADGCLVCIEACQARLDPSAAQQSVMPPAGAE